MALPFFYSEYPADKPGEDIPGPGRIVFDWVFAVVMPVVCLIFDPAVFVSSLDGGMLSDFRLMGYLAIGLGMVSFIACRVWSAPVGWRAGLIAGGLFGGALFASLLGLIMLPLTMAGMAMLIGVFGLTPFFTSYVLFRNGREIAKKVGKSKGGICVVICAGMPLYFGGSIGPAMLVSKVADRSVTQLIEGEPGSRQRAISKLQMLAPFTNLDRLVLAWERETDPRRKQVLALAYQEITHQDLETRLANFRD